MHPSQPPSQPPMPARPPGRPPLPACPPAPDHAATPSDEAQAQAQAQALAQHWPHPPHQAPGQAPYGPAYAAPYPAPYTPPSRWTALWQGLKRTLWHNKTTRAIAIFTLLALCGVVILAMVRQQTGTQGFLVGLGLAVFPVPLLIAAFRWLDRIDPAPWRSLAFAFAWGACAATLVAILANSFATDWLATNLSAASPSDAETWGATAIAPVVEESVKAISILLLYLFRRRDFDGITDGIVIAGITATGFAFTENILYLGSAFGQDQDLGYTGLNSITAGTFFVRVIMSPFAHPLFTVLTGLAFGIAATRYPRRRPLRIALPLLGWLTAVLLHSAWNGASTLGGFGFLTVYGLFMVPVFAALTWLAVWARQQDLRSLPSYLRPYATAGWLAPTDPVALSNLKTRSIAREIARRTQGPTAARTISDYTALATSLALLRRRAHRSGPTPTFTTLEHSLLTRLWPLTPTSHPTYTQALHHTHRPYPPHLPPPPYGPPPGTPYTHPPGRHR